MGRKVAGKVTRLRHWRLLPPAGLLAAVGAGTAGASTLDFNNMNTTFGAGPLKSLSSRGASSRSMTLDAEATEPSTTSRALSFSAMAATSSVSRATSCCQSG